MGNGGVNSNTCFNWQAKTMTISHKDKPFKAPKTDDQRDQELAMERLNEKIRDGISEVVVQANTDIAALKSDLEGDITTLTGTVTTNTTNITTNTTNIAANTSSIGTINTALLTKVDEDATLAAAVLPEAAQSGIVQLQSAGGVWDSNNMDGFDWNRSNTARKGWHGVFTEKFQAIYDNQVALRNKINEIVTIING